MIKLFNFLALISLIVLNSGCATYSQNRQEKLELQNAVIGDLSETSDPVTINDVSISGNTLKIKVSFSGECNEHNFKLVGSEVISKSLPPQRSIVLIHKSNGDTCKKIVKKTLRFNVEAFSYKKEKGSAIRLNLSNWKDRIEFIYP